MAEALIDPGWRPPTLTTPRLILRAFQPVDAPSLFQAASNPKVTKYTLWDHHPTVDTSLFFINDYVRNKYLLAEPDPFALCLKENPEVVIGAIGAHWAERKSLCMEMGFWLGESYWGRGLTTEAAKTLLRWLFDTYTLERVQAHCLSENAGSGRVLEKAGFQYEGTARSQLLHRGRFWDLRWYAVLRKDLQLEPNDAGNPVL